MMAWWWFSMTICSLSSRQVMERSAGMLRRLDEDLAREQEDPLEPERSAERLAEALADLQAELKATKRQRIRDLMRHPDQEEILEQTYGELEGDLQKKIEGLGRQMALLSDRRSTILRVNRAAKTALDVLEEILAKEKLDRNDLQLIIQTIKVYEDHLEVQLKADIDCLLRCGEAPEPQPPEGAGHIGPDAIVQAAKQHPDKVFHIHVVSDGDPLEIYTSRDGEVIFKKYSLMGGLEDFAAQFCETLSKSTGNLVAVSDRDTIIAVAGGGKRDLLGKHLSGEMEQIMEDRKIYQFRTGDRALFVTDTGDKYTAAVAAPIISEGDALGLVLFVGEDGGKPTGDTEFKLAQTIAAFLGKHMEG